MFKELLHKLSYRKIELVSRIDDEKSKTLMDLINNENIHKITIQERLLLYKNEEEITNEVDIHFKPIRNLAQFRNNMMCLEKLNLHFRKYMAYRGTGVHFSCYSDDFRYVIWMELSDDIGEEKHMELLGDIMGCEIIKTTTQRSGYTTNSFACKRRESK